jgi:beta-lactam-binding protein with PASTA domain
MVEVPNVVGMEVDQAISALLKLDLNVEQPVDAIDSKAPRDQVVDEDPPANKKVEHGSTIKLKVSNGTDSVDGNTSPDEPRTDTNDGEANDYTLRIKLTDAQMAVGVRVEIEDAHGTRDVHNETHEPGEAFTVEAKGYGPDATFRIYYDGDLKKTIHETAPPTRRRRTRA